MNKETYNQNKVVNTYINYKGLQVPEETILKQYEHLFQDSTILDIGVGAGRTSKYLLPLFKEYFGIDYSKKMVDYCKLKFPKNQSSFSVVDVRNLNKFTDYYFDFVLFSFNGIDYINNNDRKKALLEIKRVLGKNGVFIFSTHNINYLLNYFSLPSITNPVSFLKKIYRISMFYIYNCNPKKFINNNYTIVNDGAHNYSLDTYYIKPSEQVKNLLEIGFRSVELFSIQTGEKIKFEEIDTITDSWIYYKCCM